jgi:hypothetical protein
VACATAGGLAIPTQDAAAQVTVGGVGYGQFQYALAKDTLAADSVIQHINNFDVTRAYVNVIGRFPGGVTTRITTDIFTNGAIPGSRIIRLKYAYVAWNPGTTPLTYKIGAMHTPWIDWEEALWDYRMQGTMAMERGSPVTGISYLTSSDFGAGVDGKWAADRFNFQAGVYNGETYNGALSDQHKDVMARASYRVMNTDDGTRVGGLRVTAYGQYGAPGTGGRRNRMLGMVSYRSTDITVAAQVAMTQDSVHGGLASVGGAAIAAAPLRHGRVISVFGTFHPHGTRFTAIGRVDITDPQTDSTATAPGTNDQTTRLIAGVAYQLTPNLRLLGNVDLVTYESGFVPVSVNYAPYAARQSANVQVMFTY